MMDEQGNSDLVLSSDPSAACLFVVGANQHSAVSCDSSLPPIADLTTSSSQFASNRTKTIELVVNGVKRVVIVPIADSEDDVTVPTTTSPATAPTAPQLQRQPCVSQPPMLQRAAVASNASADSKAQLRLQSPVYSSQSVVSTLSSSGHTVHHQAFNPPAGYTQQQRPQPGVNNNNNNDFSQFTVPSQKTVRHTNNNNTYSLPASRPPQVYQAQPGNSLGTRFPTIGTNSMNGVVLPSTANNPYGFSLALRSFAGQANTGNGLHANQMQAFQRVGTLFPTNPQPNPFVGNVPFVSQNVGYNWPQQQQPQQMSLSFGNVALQVQQPVFQSLPPPAPRQISGCVQTVASNQTYNNCYVAPPSYNVNIQVAQQHPQTLAVNNAAWPAYNAANLSIPTCQTMDAFTRNYPHLSSTVQNLNPVSLLLGSNCMSTLSGTMTASSGSSTGKLSSSSCDGGRFPMYSGSGRLPNANLPTVPSSVSAVGNQLFNHFRWRGWSSANNNTHTNKAVRAQKLQKSADTGKGGIVYTPPRPIASDIVQPMLQFRQQSVNGVKNNSDFSQFCIGSPKAAARPVAPKTTTTSITVSTVQQVNKTMTVSVSASQTVNSETSDFSDSIIASLLSNDASVPPVTNASNSCRPSTANDLDDTLVAETDLSGVDNPDVAMSNLLPDVINAAMSDLWTVNDFCDILAPQLPASPATGSGVDVPTLADCQNVDENQSRSVTHSSTEIHQALQIAKSIGKGMHHVEEEKNRRRELQQLRQRRNRRKQQLTSLEYDDDVSTNSSDSWRPDGFESQSTDKSPSSPDLTDNNSSSDSWSSQDSVTMGRSRRNQPKVSSRRKSRSTRSMRRSRNVRTRRSKRHQKERNFEFDIYSSQVKPCSVSLELLKLRSRRTINVKYLERFICCVRHRNVRHFKRIIVDDVEDDDDTEVESTDDVVIPARVGMVAKRPRIDDTDSS